MSGEPIADHAIGLVALLEWGDPIAIAFYPDHAEKAQLVETARMLALPRVTREIRSGLDALPLLDQDALIILDPANPKADVEFLDHNRDHFEGASARLLLLLLGGGEGQRALQDAPALSSFARSLSFDVAGARGPSEAATAFEEAYGMTHDEWLRRWRTGELPDTFGNNLVLAEALTVEG